VLRTTQQLTIKIFIFQQTRKHRLSALLSKVITVHLLPYWRNPGSIMGDMEELGVSCIEGVGLYIYRCIAIPQKPQQLAGRSCTYLALLLKKILPG